MSDEFWDELKWKDGETIEKYETRLKELLDFVAIRLKELTD